MKRCLSSGRTAWLKGMGGIATPWRYPDSPTPRPLGVADAFPFGRRRVFEQLEPAEQGADEMGLRGLPVIRRIDEVRSAQRLAKDRSARIGDDAGQARNEGSLHQNAGNLEQRLAQGFVMLLEILRGGDGVGPGPFAFEKKSEIVKDLPVLVGRDGVSHGVDDHVALIEPEFPLGQHEGLQGVKAGHGAFVRSQDAGIHLVLDGGNQIRIGLDIDVEPDMDFDAVGGGRGEHRVYYSVGTVCDRSGHRHGGAADIEGSRQCSAAVVFRDEVSVVVDSDALLFDRHVLAELRVHVQIELVGAAGLGVVPGPDQNPLVHAAVFAVVIGVDAVALVQAVERGPRHPPDFENFRFVEVAGYEVGHLRGDLREKVGHDHGHGIGLDDEAFRRAHVLGGLHDHVSGQNQSFPVELGPDQVFGGQVRGREHFVGRAFPEFVAIGLNRVARASQRESRALSQALEDGMVLHLSEAILPLPLVLDELPRALIDHGLVAVLPDMLGPFGHGPLLVHIPGLNRPV